MQTVLAQAIPNQQLQCQFGNQSVTLVIVQYATGLFISVAAASVPILNSALCKNRTRIVRDAYLGFDGDFIWIDTQGDSDPSYAGIGTRFLLIYLSSDDLAAG